MSRANYYRASLALPLALPAVSYVVFPPDGANPGSGVTSLLLMSLLFGGLPYLVLVAVLLLRFRGKAEDQLEGAVLLAPFALVPLVWLELLCVGIYGLVSSGDAWGQLGLVFLGMILTVSVLGIGYAYVLIVSVFLVLFRWWGWVKADDRWEPQAP